MAVPVRPNGLDDVDVGDVNALFAEGLEEFDPEDEEDMPPYIHDIEVAHQRHDFDAFRQTIDNLPGGIDEQLYDGYTALHVSCLFGHVSFVQLLLQRGANLEIRDDSGAIPLHYACGREDFRNIVLLLLEEASDRGQVKGMLDTVNAEGNTPLHCAAEGKNIDICRLLLLYGASPTKINSKGKTPIEEIANDTDFRRELEVEVAAVARRGQ